MSLTEQIYAHARVLIRDMDGQDQALLQTLCRAAEVSLTAKLRSGVTPDDCRADFIAAASLYAVAALSQVEDGAQVEQLSVSDLTLRRSGSDAACSCLRYQAELLMTPYVADRFAFVGV